VQRCHFVFVLDIDAAAQGAHGLNDVKEVLPASDVQTALAILAAKAGFMCLKQLKLIEKSRRTHRIDGVHVALGLNEQQRYDGVMATHGLE
jgi:hypothetical protein